MRKLNAYQSQFILSLTGSLIIIFLVATVLAGVIFYVIALRVELPGSYSAIIATASVIKLEIIRLGFVIYAAFTLLALVGVVALSVLYSHRVAGPLERVKIVSKEIAAGNFDVNCKFRDSDAIHPLADAINEMSGSLKKRYEVMEAGLEHLKAEAHKLDEAITRDDKEAVQRSIAVLGSKSEEMDEIIRGLRL